MRTSRVLIFLIFSLATSGVFAFGQTGHRVTGALAERYLTDEAKRAIAEILQNENLAEISTYCDEQRSNPSEFWQKTSPPWHYMTVPDGQTYTLEMAPPQGDVMVALQQYTDQLKHPKSTREEKALALKFIVHLIGDMHQPLHVGNGTDRGGNDVKLEFFWQKSNLHRVWDSGMIDNQKLSYTEWTHWLSKKITAADVTAWSSIDPFVWAKESQILRMKLYPEQKRISYSYQYQNLPILKQRLQQAGVRMGLYLNAVFSD